MRLEASDCIEFLRKMPNDSVDMIIADPPYFIGYDGGKGWDDQWASEAEYLGWCRLWTDECSRVLKSNRIMVVWGTLKTDTFLRYKLDVLNRTELTGQNEIIWSYNWGGRSSKNFGRKHEYAWVYSKGQNFLFNADDIRAPRKVTKNIRTGLPYEKGTVPTLVWEANNHTMSKDYINWHPTTKNVGILARLIRAYTLPGELVLDIFSGSGSTAIAAMRNGRDFIGCDFDEEYVSRSLERIECERRR